MAFALVCNTDRVAGFFTLVGWRCIGRLHVMEVVGNAEPCNEAGMVWPWVPYGGFRSFNQHIHTIIMVLPSSNKSDLLGTG